MKTFFDIVESIADTLNLKKDGDKTCIKRYVNSAYQEFNNKTQWDWRLKTAILPIIPLYSTGTVTATQGSRTITGDSTVWTSAMEDRYIQIDNSNNYYRIVNVASNTSLTVDTPFVESSVSAKGYKIWKRFYPLIPDVKEVAGVSGKNGDLINKDFNVYIFSEGSPSYFKFAEKYNIITTVNFTSSITSTKDSNVITGSGTTFITDLQVGDNFYLTSINKQEEYNILKIVSDTTLYLCQNAKRTETAISAIANRKDLIQLEFDSSPTTNNENIYYKYYKRTYNMLNDNDEPEIPEEYRDVLYWGGIKYSIQNLVRDTKLVGVELSSKRIYDDRVREISNIEMNKSDKPDCWSWI